MICAVRQIERSSLNCICLASGDREINSSTRSAPDDSHGAKDEKTTVVWFEFPINPFGSTVY